ncbi:MAG: hypothetical protein OSJ70_10320 [Bacilli bacterium]|nr:hypothetical protein [Bacilli bacterium]
MEKKYYNFDDFFTSYMRNASVKYGTEAEIYHLDGKVYKIFNSTFGDRNEESIETIGKMDSKYLTIPRELIYLGFLGYEYYGYVMDDAGDNLANILKTQDLSFDERYEILCQIKEALLYIEKMNAHHGDLTLANVLYDGKIARIGDVNNLTVDNATPRLNYLGRFWYRTFESYKTVDRLAFNFMTYLLLNFSLDDIRELLPNERNNPMAHRMNVLDRPNKVFDEDIWSSYERELLRGKKLVLENKDIDKDMLLIDYLK